MLLRISCLLLMGFSVTSPIVAQTKNIQDSIDNLLKKLRKTEGMQVIVQASVYEVDEATRKKIGKSKWMSKEELDKLEEKVLKKDGKVNNQAFELLDKLTPIQKRKTLIVGVSNNIQFRGSAKRVKLLAIPDSFQPKRMRSVKSSVGEGVILQTRMSVSADRRYVCATFIEDSVEIEGKEKVITTINEKGEEVVLGESASLKEQKISWSRYIPDGGTLIVPLHFRSRELAKKGHWLVAKVVARIYIPEEEKLRRQSEK